MGQRPSNTKQKEPEKDAYFFRNLDAEDKGWHRSKTLAEWKKNILEEGGLVDCIVKHRQVFRCSLSAFKKCPSLGKSRHELILFDCDNENDERIYVSFEKGLHGLYAQVSRTRDDPLEDYSSDEHLQRPYLDTSEGLKKTPSDKVVPLEDFFEFLITTRSTKAGYHLFFSNCQHFVKALEEEFGKFVDSSHVTKEEWRKRMIFNQGINIIKQGILTTCEKVSLPGAGIKQNMKLEDLYVDICLKKESSRTDFLHFMENIDESIKKNVRKFMICAPGGYGKTTASRKYAYGWAKMYENVGVSQILNSGGHLVIRIDLKKFGENELCRESYLMNAILEQDSFSTFSDEEKYVFYKELIKNREKLIFILDSFDECKNGDKVAEIFKSSNNDPLTQSTVVIFGRPEVKYLLDQDEINYEEYEIQDLSEDKFNKYIDKYPFTGDEEKKEKKKQSVLEKCQFGTFKSFVKVPLCATLICALHDYDNCQSVENIHEEIDLFLGIIALCIRIEQIKEIDKNNQTKEEQQKEKKRLKQLKSVEVIQRNKDLLLSFGKALFELNGFRLDGYKDYNVTDLETIMGPQNLQQVLRFSLFEVYEKPQPNDTNTIPVLHFYSRFISELLLSIYIVFNQKELGKQHVGLWPYDTGVILCSFTLMTKLRLPTEELRSCLSHFVSFIFQRDEFPDNFPAHYYYYQIFSALIWLYSRLDGEQSKVVVDVILQAKNYIIKYFASKDPPEECILQYVDESFFECITIHCNMEHCPDCTFQLSHEDKSHLDEATLNLKTLWPTYESFCITPILCANRWYNGFICIPDKGQLHLQKGCLMVSWDYDSSNLLVLITTAFS